MNQPTIWGEDLNRSFTHLTPDQILQSVEKLGYRTTGRMIPLNSMENRVYQIEVEDTRTYYVVVKFYRPGRWSVEQILEEHQFTLELLNEEIPVVAPLVFNQQTLFQLEESGIHYALYPRVGGRIPSELSEEQLQVAGRFMARIHAVGKLKEAKYRITLNPATYGLSSLELLQQGQFIPLPFALPYQDLVKEICDKISPLFEKTPMQRIHGDFHLGNLLWGDQGPMILDFDDMVTGPCIQDLWPMIPGRDPETLQQRNILISAYETMNDFDDFSLKLIEPLRALRLIYFSAWIAKRWKDDSFRRVFCNFGTDYYWQDQIHILKEQLFFINQLSQPSSFS